MSQLSENPETETIDPPAQSKWPLILLLAILAGLSYWLLFGGSAPRFRFGLGSQHPSVGTAKLALDAPALEDQNPGLAARDFQGKVTLVNFWGPWCPPCREEFPAVYQIYRKHQNHAAFQCAFISCAGGRHMPELALDTRAFLKQRAYKAPVYLDQSGGVTHAAGQQLQLTGFNFPTTALVGRDGIVRGLWIGFQESYIDEIAEAVERELARRD